MTTRLLMWIIFRARATWRSFWLSKLDVWAEILNDDHDIYTERRRIHALEIRTAARRPMVPKRWLN